MRYLFDAYDLFKNQISGKNLFLFLDYDGTLTPIVERPEMAVLAKATKDLLEKLAQDRGVKIGIVSGRALADIRERVGLKEISYIGNHGFEIDAPGVNFKGYDLSGTRETMDHLKLEISDGMGPFKGAFIEDKGISLSVHFRQLNEGQTEAFRIYLKGLTGPFISRQLVHADEGKKVVEIKPPVDWDKGKAVLWLLDQYKSKGDGVMPVFIGDDVTDEDAFKSLQGKGVTIKVGEQGDTAADYFVKQQPEVIHLLKDLLALGKDAS
jgi:trehalose-phosphatase